MLSQKGHKNKSTLGFGLHSEWAFQSTQKLDQEQTVEIFTRCCLNLRELDLEVLQVVGCLDSILASVYLISESELELTKIF
jgi:hypothetical protein